MEYSKVFDILLPLFITIAIGYIFGRLKEINIKPVIDLILYITVPCLVISSITKNPLNIKDFLVIPAAAVFVIIGSGLITLGVLRVFKVKPTPGIFISSMFMNSGIMAFPIVLEAYGLEALSKAVLYDAVNGLLLFSLGIFILLGKDAKAQVLKLPVIWSIALAMALNLLGIALPHPLPATLKFIGDSTIPIMLIVLGYQLNYIRSYVFGYSILSSVIRMGLGILMALAFVNIFNIQGVLRTVIILSSSMPTAINSLALSAEYKVDADLTATTVMITTVLSFITIPLVLHYII